MVSDSDSAVRLRGGQTTIVPLTRVDKLLASMQTPKRARMMAERMVAKHWLALIVRYQDCVHYFWDIRIARMMYVFF
jgi:hypothetical protein